MADLSDLDRELLVFEAEHPVAGAAKAEAIAAAFGLRPARYFQLLRALIQRPEALAFDPVLVGRLLRVHEGRARARAARGFAPRLPHATE
ncbi:MAG: DUF3263 domain-containing protein [Patescibacteria group bacterium]|nr:DUF3263 domain-containing protein [Patescibacteria group bacterium]